MLTRFFAWWRGRLDAAHAMAPAPRTRRGHVRARPALPWHQAIPVDLEAQRRRRAHLSYIQGICSVPDCDEAIVGWCKTCRESPELPHAMQLCDLHLLAHTHHTAHTPHFTYDAPARVLETDEVAPSEAAYYLRGEGRPS